jgi:hypothetical protein
VRVGVGPTPLGDDGRAIAVMPGTAVAPGVNCGIAVGAGVGGVSEGGSAGTGFLNCSCSVLQREIARLSSLSLPLSPASLERAIRRELLLLLRRMILSCLAI